MALEMTGLPRKFRIITSGKAVVMLNDINPSASVDQIKNLYGDDYPELVSAGITGPVTKENHILYTFSPKAGTKG